MCQFRRLITRFIVLLSLYAVIQPGLCYASEDNEKSIIALFNTHGKNNVVKVVLEKRNGKITIQKHMSFVDIYGKPDLSLITAKSIIHDLGMLQMSISEFSAAVGVQQTKQQMTNQISNTVKVPEPVTDKKPVALSTELKQKINLTKHRYANSKDQAEKRRLQNELSILRAAYKRALRNEKQKLNVYFPDVKKKKSYKHNSAACERAKARLQEVSNPVFRHQVFYCSDKEYVKENPGSCDDYKYKRKYDLKEYKKEIIRLNDNVSKSCKTNKTGG